MALPFFNQLLASFRRLTDGGAGVGATSTLLFDPPLFSDYTAISDFANNANGALAGSDSSVVSLEDFLASIADVTDPGAARSGPDWNALLARAPVDALDLGAQASFDTLLSAASSEDWASILAPTQASADRVDSAVDPLAATYGGWSYGPGWGPDWGTTAPPTSVSPAPLADYVDLGLAPLVQSGLDGDPVVSAATTGTYGGWAYGEGWGPDWGTTAPPVTAGSSLFNS